MTEYGFKIVGERTAGADRITRAAILHGDFMAWFTEDTPDYKAGMWKKGIRGGPVVLNDEPAYLLDSTKRKWRAHAQKVELDGGNIRVEVLLTGEEGE